VAGRLTTWPIERVLDSVGRPTAWAVVHAPVVSPHRQAQLAGLRWDGVRCVGMTSDMDFPLRTGDAVGDDPLDYGLLCEAWCHCFREPDRYLPVGPPRILLSASDFTIDVAVREQATRARGRTGRRGGRPFDFLYVGPSMAWKRAAKGWPLARRCLPLLCGQLGLRGLAVGIPSAELGPIPGLTVVPELPWPRFLAELSQTRALFVPNGPDASPRVLAEALSLDVPLVVHRAILGGWKYVTPWTGTFFEDERDIGAAMRACLAGSWRPSAWFRTHQGPYLAGRRLLRLLRSLDPTLRERSHVVLEHQLTGAGPAA
jgi:hypothetical protein